MPTREGPVFPESDVPIVYAKTFLGDKNYVRLLHAPCSVTSGQSYKGSTIINYDSRVVVISKWHIFTTLDS